MYYKESVAAAQTGSAHGTDRLEVVRFVLVDVEALARELQGSGVWGVGGATS